MNVEDLQLCDLIEQSQPWMSEQDLGLWIVTRLPSLTEADIRAETQIQETISGLEWSDVDPEKKAILATIGNNRCHYFLCFESSGCFLRSWDMRNDDDRSLDRFMGPVKVYRAGRLIFDSEIPRCALNT